MAAAAVPFTAASARALLAGTSPGKAKVSKKTIQNARSAIERVLRFYGLEQSSMRSIPLTAEFAGWLARFSRYEKASAGGLFRFLSMRGRQIREVCDADAEAYLALLEAEFPAKASRTKHKQAIRAWNNLATAYPGWAGRQLTRRLVREPWALPWDRFPSSLKADVGALFAARETSANLFAANPRGRKLKPSTIRNRREHLRVAASILCVRCGVQTGDLVGLPDLCRPARFKSVIGTIVERYDGKVTAYVEQVAITLLQAARECGPLTDAEIAEVKALRRAIYVRGLADRRNDVHPDQKILDQLDDVECMNALLSLPTRTAASVIRDGRLDRRSALKMEMATALECWLPAPVRLTNYVMLRIDEHIFWIGDGSRKRVVIRIPGTETKNGKPVEHYLHDDAASLLELYLKLYRPLLADRASPWLFPGRKGTHKRAAVLARQMKAYVWEGAGIPFHPHLIRKIATKIILDNDPAAIEIARIILGHEDLRTTRGAYAQAQVRSAQTLYLEAMEERRLARHTSTAAPDVPGDRHHRRFGSARVSASGTEAKK